jgi:hypothetical protein
MATQYGLSFLKQIQRGFDTVGDELTYLASFLPVCSKAKPNELEIAASVLIGSSIIVPGLVVCDLGSYVAEREIRSRYSQSPAAKALGDQRVRAAWKKAATSSLETQGAS